MLLDASNSTVLGQNSSGLVFNWVCPAIFAKVCEMFKFSPVLEITDNAMYAAQADKNVDYNITLQVWSLGFGTECSGSHVFS